MEKIKTKKLIIIIAILIAVLLCAGIYSYASQQVKIKISQTPNVDIVLTKSQTEFDLTNFEQNLKQELINQKVMTQTEIDNGKLNISAVDTQIIETQSSFSWQKDIDSNIGSVTFTNNGKNVSMVGNTKNAGKNAIWIIPEGSQDKTFNFGYNIDFGDSFNAAGMLLRVRKNSDGTLEGYMLSFNKSSKTFYKGASNSNGALWYFKYDGNNSTAFSVGTDIKLISALNINTSGTLNVKVTDKNITITGGGLSSAYTYTYKSGESYGEGYGFFSDHYSHNCSDIGGFTLTNINLQTETVKKFTEVLQAPEWRDGAVHILIDVQDNQNEQFSNNSELTAIIAKLMNSDVYYIGWGTENNRSQMQNLITKNDNKGIYVGNSSSNAVKETVEYIKSITKKDTGNIVIAGEAVNVEVTSPETGVETPTEEFPNGVWKVIHDDQYYQNSQNQYELNNIYTNELIQNFDNVGKYYIYCEDKLITEVYAHRRPVASFNMNVVGNQISLLSNSYDLDIEQNTENTEEQKQNNGIKTEKWEYKKTTENTWYEITSTGVKNKIEKTLEANTEYMIRLTVTDYQGVETSAIKYIVTKESTVKPIASYKVINKQISVYENLEIIDESYDPSGASLNYIWTVTKENKQVYKGNKPLLNYSTSTNSNYGIGTYKMTLVVSKTVSGITISSDEFSQNIEIIKDTTPPAITVEPSTEETQNKEIPISVKLTDNESGVKSYQYAFSENVTEENKQWSKEIAVTGNNVKETITLSREYTDKKIYLFIKATNQDGTVSKEKVTGPYYINPYQLELQVADSETGIAVTGAVYNIIGEKSNGQLVEIAKNATSDANGKIYVEKAKLKDITSIKIENKQQAAGYELAEYKTVKIDTTDSKIKIDMAETSDGVETQVSENGQSIQIKVYLEKIKFNLEITNIDAETANLLSGTSFKLKKDGSTIAEGITQDGKLIFTVPIANINTTQEYILEQTYINESYNNIENTYLKITFNQNGEVSTITQKLFAENSAVTIPDNTKANLIIENERKDIGTFEVKINVKDYVDETPIEGSKYKISVQTSSGLKYVTNTYESDENGNITIDNLYGTGLIKLTFIHETPAEGYQKETTDRYITIDRATDGKITYNKDSIKNVFDKIEENTVYVNLTNVQKASTNAIKMNLVSKEDPSVGLGNIGVNVYKILDNSLIASGTTDVNGYLELLDVQNDGKGEVLYRIEFENNVLGISPIIVIKYENYKIKDAYQITTIDGINVYQSEDDDEDYYKYVANINIQGTMKGVEGENKLIIHQKDKTTGTSVEGGQYKVKMTVNDSLITKVIKTNENGKAQTNLLDDKTLTIQITQTKAADGYTLDSKTKTILLTKDSSGTYKIKSVKNIDISQVTIDSNGNVLVTDEVSSNKYTKVNIKIAKTDDTEKLSLGGFKFNVSEETTGYSETAITDSKGYITLNEFIATEAKSYTFKIEEIETIEPYKLLEKTVNLEIRFTNENGIITYNGTSYLQGRESIADGLVEYDSEQNQLAVYLTIKNTTDNEAQGQIYDLDINKIDSNGNKVLGAEYDIEIRPYAESSIISSNTVIDDNIEVENLSIKKDKTTILLKEISPAIGFGLDEEIKVVTLTIDDNGELIYVPETTTKDLIIEITSRIVDGVERKLVKITIVAKEAEEEEAPVPTVPTTPEEPEEPVEERPTDAKVAIKVYNKSYGDWTKEYTIKTLINSVTGTYKLENAQKLERIFKDTTEAQKYGFNFITSSEITLETRLITDGVVSEKIYETAKSKANTNINDTNGTDSIYLYNDYKNKKVEITVIQNAAPYNYKRVTTDIKFIAEFDENGNMISGTIKQGNDTEEFAIGGISEYGIVDNIKYLSEENKNIIGSVTNETYDTGEIKQYNSIGTSTIHLALLNKQISNNFEINVNLKDIDTDNLLDGEVSVIVWEKNDDSYKPVEYHTMDVINGIGTLKLDNTYANRTLRIEISQIANGRKSGYEYINNATITTKFIVKFDDNANVEDFDQISISDNVKYEGVSTNKVEYTIYNEIKYNFAINVKKLGEDSLPLEGVRIHTDAYYVKNIVTDEKEKIFENNSAKTDENGNLKLKIMLPESGTYKYAGQTIDFVLSEYYVPNNYTAIEEIKIRILFDTIGKVASYQVISDTQENTTILNKNQIEKDSTELAAIGLQIKNGIINNKTIMQITNSDSEDNTIKLNGTQYKVSSWNEAEYGSSSLNYDETHYSNKTDSNGQTKIYFDNGYALKTIIYKIEEIQSANSYIKNNDILIRVTYDKNGTISKMPEFLTKQYINVPVTGNILTAEIEGNPVGENLLKINIVNELEARFSIDINKKELKNNTNYNSGTFKITSQVKNSDGTYQNTEETRISSTMYKNNAKVGFKTLHKNQTVLYTIYEPVGTTYIERGKIEVTFDDYGNVTNQVTTGKYLTKTIYTPNSNYVSTYINVENFYIDITVESNTKTATYSLAGYTFDIENSKGEKCSATTKTNSMGNVVELIGEIYKGETITYDIKSLTNPIDYEPTKNIQLTVTFDENGQITSCTPIAETNVYNLISIEKDTSNNTDMQIKLYADMSEREEVIINVKDYADSTKDIPSALYKVTSSYKSTDYSLIVTNGTGNANIASCQQYKNKVITYTLKQIDVDAKYMINDNDIQIIVIYDSDGKIQDAQIVASDGYVEIDKAASVGTTQLKLNTKNSQKVKMQVYNINKEENTIEVKGNTFEIKQKSKSDLYADTKVTGTDGRASLYVGPYYTSQKITYEIKNTTTSIGYKQIDNAEFTLTYDKNKKVIEAEVNNLAQNYLTIEIPDTKSNYYGITDIIITVQSDPLFTIGVDAIDKTTNTQLSGAEYQIRQSTNNKINGSVITAANSTEHACIGETQPGKTLVYEIVEIKAPLGYKYKNLNSVIGTIQVTYDGDGKIIKDNTKILSGNEYITLKNTSDKLETFDIDIQITYEETEEFKVIIENENILDNTDKIQSNFNLDLTTGVYKTISTNSNGLAEANFGKITAINSTQTLTISQSNIKGSYAGISNIKISISFDESGKVKSYSTYSGLAYASSGVVYNVTMLGSYTLKITVKNNPVTKFNIKNVSVADNTIMVNSTHQLSGKGISGSLNLVTTNGQASTVINPTPKDETVTYTLRQTSVSRGYALNKNITVKVTYNKEGKITSVSASSDDGAAIKSITHTGYEINIEVKNQQKFEIYVKTEDKFSGNIIYGAALNIEEITKSKKSVNITTNSAGLADATIGSTITNGYLDYKVKLINKITGYDDSNYNTSYSFRVYYGSNGQITSCTTSSSILEVNYVGGLAVEVKVKYTPQLAMEIKRTNSSTSTSLGGKKINISSSVLKETITSTTNSSGKISINAGNIKASNTVKYTIREQSNETDTNMEKLPTINVFVTYDDKGKIVATSTDQPNYVTINLQNTRKIEVEIGTKKITTMAILTSDYFNNTLNITATYQITSDKGDSFNISSSTTKSNKIVEMGKAYPGEKITYVLHQTSGQRGYETVEDQIFYVQYKADGTIESVTPKDANRIIVKKIRQQNTSKEPNIMLQLLLKPSLEISLKVTDSSYLSGVYGLSFKVKNEDTGVETTVGKTDKNGMLKLTIPSIYENKNVNYTITQTDTMGGYKILEPIQLVVSYGNLGIINEKGTYILNSTNASVTPEYSTNLYKSSRIRGVQVEIQTETEMGIGIEKVDVYGNKLNGIEYIITAKQDNTTDSKKIVTDANGETTTYLGEMPKGKVVEYTISELQAPTGYRKIEDAIIKVYYNENGKIISYSIEQQPENVTIQIATNNLYKMSNSQESVHLKLKIINDNRVTFKIVNRDQETLKPIENAEFSLSVDDANGTLKSVNVKTDSKGQATIENIEANGDLTFYFNQINIPENCLPNSKNSGFIKINKDSKQYKLTYLNGTNNLNYTIDNQTGIVTVYLTNENNLILNIIDVDGETGEKVNNATHTVKAQYGEIDENVNDILAKTNNIIFELGPENSINAVTLFNIGNTYQLFDKKVVFTVSTPTSPDNTSSKYNLIKDQYFVVEFNERGLIKNTSGLSARIDSVTNSNELTINAVISYGDIDNYKIKIVKQAENSSYRINGVTFDMNLNVEGIDVKKYTNLVTNSKNISGTVIEDGIIEIEKLKFEGKTKITLTEKNAPKGYEGLIGTPIEINLDISLEKTDMDDVKLNVNNQSCNSENVEIQVNRITREITIKVINTPVIELELNKFDEDKNLLANMNFNISVQAQSDLANVVNYGIFTTSEQGNIKAKINNKYFGDTIFITLTEEKHEYYKEIVPITIKVKISNEGEILSAEIISGDSNSTIANTTTAITLSVINTLEEFAKPYEMKIIKVNENDRNIRIPNVLFQVKVTPDVGIPIYKVEKTDENGEINLKGLIGSGNIIIELREVEAPAGYQLGETDGYYKYQVKKDADVLQLIYANLSEDLVDIDVPNKVIDIYVPNKTELAGLAINKVDESDYELNIANTTFKLKDVETSKEYIVTTDNKGIAYFSLPKGVSEIKEYELTEMIASDGYKLNSKTKTIQIVYNEEGKIQTASEEEGLEITEKNSSYLKYAVTNEQAELDVLPYNIKVVNIDKDNNKITIPNSQFNIKIKQTYGAKLLEATKKTNENGEISLNVNGAGDTTISLTNTKAGNGYNINNNILNVSLNRNQTSGNIKINEEKNVTTKYDEANNTLTIYVESELSTNQYSVQVNIVDSVTNTIINDKNVKLNITFNEESKKLTTDESGKIVVTGLTIPDLEKFKINIEEVQEPTGYKKVEDLQKIIANVTKIYEGRAIYNIDVIEGNNIQVVTVLENTIIVNLLHQPFETSDEDLYLTSDIYRVTENYVERISGPRTVKDYLANMKSNGEMKVFDKNGNEVAQDSYVGTGMTITATKGEQSITKTLSVIGDVTGDGLIKALDISLMKQHLIGKKNLEGAYFLAGDINDDGEIKALDISKEKQAIIGKITL